MALRFAASIFVLPIVALVIGTQCGLAARSESVLHDFADSDGAFPQGSLVADKAGNLYGTAPLGGDVNNDGVVFVIDTNGAFSIIHRFQGTPNDGSDPNATLTIDKSGVLYGTTSAGGVHGQAAGPGGGTVFQLVPAGGGAWTENVLYNFCAKEKCADGGTPVAPLVMAKDGTLYGTTELGGIGAALANHGTLFRLTQDGDAWKHTVLHDFCNQPNCADGAYPFSGRLLLSKAGLLYGTTTASDHSGTLYSLAEDGSGFEVRHDFGIKSGDGEEPFDGVIAGPDGVFYGMTPTGGAHGCGTAYSYDPASSSYRTFHSFCATTGDAAFPEGSLMLLDDKSGTSLYGMSSDGGASNKGVLFRFRRTERPGAHWTENRIYSFCAQAACADGYRPAAGPPLRFRGAFYGTASRGGASDEGVIFRFGKD